mmetsp:Transcript_3085/g.8052  ORF Transcript_3085/g.8052 Transcript_3085/m.8052 type:complete len:249 (-) Transcript_3085:1110-1856(-)
MSLPSFEAPCRPSPRNPRRPCLPRRREAPRCKPPPLTSSRPRLSPRPERRWSFASLLSLALAEEHCRDFACRTLPEPPPLCPRGRALRPRNHLPAGWMRTTLCPWAPSSPPGSRNPPPRPPSHSCPSRLDPAAASSPRTMLSGTKRRMPISSSRTPRQWCTPCTPACRSLAPPCRRSHTLPPEISSGTTPRTRSTIPEQMPRLPSTSSRRTQYLPPPSWPPATMLSRPSPPRRRQRRQRHGRYGRPDP